MNNRENIIKAIRFERPDHIPMHFYINSACWDFYPHDALFELIETHPFLFPDYKRPPAGFVPEYLPIARKGSPYTDDWGCVWEANVNGITGAVISHPLASWDSFESYIPPDPAVLTSIGPIDWAQAEADVKKEKEQGRYVKRGLRHGHTFLRITYIRGYENAIIDMADDEPKLWKLIEMVEEFNRYVVERYSRMDVDAISYPEDLGMQVGPMLHPEHFRKYFKPSYKRLMKIASDKGIAIHMHSDGDIRTLADDLTESGVQILNIQDLVNGIDWIAEKYKGKVCIELDIDRQKITPFGTPAQVDALIKEEVEKLSAREGGLIMMYGLYPGVPLENAKALMDAMERYA